MNFFGVLIFCFVVGMCFGLECESNGRCAWVLTPYVDVMPVPPILTQFPTRITMQETRARLHQELPEETILWGYNGMVPGPTLVGQHNVSLTIVWKNGLPKEHRLVVDRRVHGVTDNRTRVMPHIHGSKTFANSDGLPENAYGSGQERSLRYGNVVKDGATSGTLFYHDHALGITRLNVAMGLYGACLVLSKSLLASFDPRHDIPLLVTDASLTRSAQLWYPDTIRHGSSGNHLLVNGRISPRFPVDTVAPYLFRLVNLCTSNTIEFRFSANFSLPYGEGGSYSSVTLGAGESFDFMLDFSSDAISGSQVEVRAVRMEQTFQLLRFDKIGVKKNPSAAAKNRLFLPAAKKRGPLNVNLNSLVHRKFTLGTRPSNVPNMLSKWTVNGLEYDNITEFARIGSHEIWEFHNPSMMDHPMHIHAISMSVLERFSLRAPTGPMPLTLADVAGGREKTTVLVPPFSSVVVLVHFEGPYLGRFVYHCHDLHHEDHAMMRRFLIVNQDSKKCNRDGVCQCGEDCVTCPHDCPLVAGHRCGNGICELGDGESDSSCPVDCVSRNNPRRMHPSLPACPGDMLCEGAEEASWNPVDCARQEEGDEWKCGNCVCEPGESSSSCPQDCYYNVRYTNVANVTTPIVFDYKLSPSPPLNGTPQITMQTVVFAATGFGACCLALAGLFFWLKFKVSKELQ